MQSYAVVLACPLAILNQHIFSEFRISYKKYKKIILSYLGWELLLLLVLNYFYRYSVIVKLEYILSCIVGLIIGGFIAKFEPQKSIDSYEASEDIVCVFQIIIGIAVCIYVFSGCHEAYFLSQFSRNEAILSKIIYIRLGISYILYNRKSFYFVHILRNKKRD